MALIVSSLSFAQVTIGTGNDGGSVESPPFNPYYGFSYGQSIYLASEINASGDITSFDIALNAGSNIDSADEMVDVWIGTTTKTAFASTTDWFDVSTLTQVLTSGTLVAANDQFTVNFSSPFTYNGTDNLVIAIYAPESGFNSSSDYVLSTDGPTPGLSLMYRNDSTNPDPSSPPTGTLRQSRGNITFNGIVESCPLPTAIASSNVTEVSADFSWTASGSETGGYNWEVVPQGDPQGTNTVVSGTTATGVVATSVVGLIQNTNYDFYVQTVCASGNSAYSVATSFTTLESCPAPSGINLLSSSSTELSVSWTNNSTATVSSVEYGEVGFTPGSGTVVSGTGDAVTISNLAANSAYDIYITQDCTAANNGLSTQVGPVEFQTECAILTPDYIEGFDTFLPECWEEATGPISGPTAFGGAGWTSDGFGNNGTTGSARFNIFSTGGDDWLISPTFDLSTGGYEINLDVALTTFNGTSQGDINADDVVYLMQSIDNGATWTVLFTWDENNEPSNTGDTEVIDISSLNSATTKFAVYALEGSTSGGDFNFYVDNFQVRTPPSCPDTTNLTVVSVTATTANIIFDSNNPNSVGTFEYAVTAPGAGAPITATSALIDATAAGMNPNVAFTIGNGATTGPELTPQTTYDLYVREECSPGVYGAWTSSPVAFTTNCSAVTTYPYITDFTSNVPNDCWGEAGSGEIVDGPLTLGSSDWRSGSYEDFSGASTPSNAINLFSDQDREWLISEQYDMAGTSNDVLTVEVAVTNWNSSTVPDVMGSDDQVDLLITTDGGITWISLMTWALANQPAVTGTREFIDLSSYTGTVQFAFLASDGTIDDSEDYDFHVGQFIIDGTAGNEDAFSTSLSLYPNPVNGDTVFIEMGSSNSSTVNISIFNTLGQQVMTKTFDQVNNSIAIDDISDLANGMYLIKVIDGSQQKTLKFIKE